MVFFKNSELQLVHVTDCLGFLPKALHVFEQYIILICELGFKESIILDFGIEKELLQK